jgi:hypothetical protein
MGAKFWTILAVVLILLLTLSPHWASASTSPAKYAVSIRDGRISVSINLYFMQNLTAIQNTFSLPQVRGVLSGANSSDVSLAVQNALDSKTPQAKVSNLFLSAATSPWSNSTNTQWLNLTLSYDVNGATSAIFGAEKADLAWKSFVVSTDIVLQAVDINNIGPKYLAAPAQQIATQQVPSKFIQVGFRVNGKAANAASFSNAAAKFNTLNFSAFSPPVSSWQKSYDFNTNNVVWSMNTGSNLGMSIIRIISEPLPETGAVPTFDYGLFYDLDARVSAPNRASASGDTITAVFSDFPQTLMGLAIAAAVVPGVGAFVYERRVSNRHTKKPKR